MFPEWQAGLLHDYDTAPVNILFGNIDGGSSVLGQLPVGVTDGGTA